MTDAVHGYRETLLNGRASYSVDDIGCIGDPAQNCSPVIFVWPNMTNDLSSFKTNDPPCTKKTCHGMIQDMDLRDKPFGAIAARLRWHRKEVIGLTQKEYAAQIGVKRPALNNWESGDYRLSLDGALALRKTYGLSLDFMFEGNFDTLPMALRAAWLERPEVSAST